VNLYGFIQNNGVHKWDFEGLYNTAREAINAAKDDVGQKAFSSRFHGEFEFDSVNLPIIYPRDIVGSDFALYTTGTINGVKALYKGVVGVEYGTYVYCNKTDGKVYYADPIRGHLPTRDEFTSTPILYGKVKIPVNTGDDNLKIIALVHTHTMAPIIAFAGGNYADSNKSIGPPLNNGPSSEDKSSASLANAPNFIVWESEPGVYYKGASANP